MRKALLLLSLLVCVGACQKPQPATPQRPTNEYTQELQFSHKKHKSHQGTPKECKDCHRLGGSSFSLPSMRSCTRCHADPSVVPNDRLIGNCSLCHERFQKSKPPEYPWHYGKKNHQTYAEQPIVYCAYCHDKDPLVFAVKEKYEGRELCVGCHQAEGLALPGGPL